MTRPRIRYRSIRRAINCASIQQQAPLGSPQQVTNIDVTRLLKMRTR